MRGGGAGQIIYLSQQEAAAVVGITPGHRREKRTSGLRHTRTQASQSIDYYHYFSTMPSF